MVCIEAQKAPRKLSSNDKIRVDVRPNRILSPSSIGNRSRRVVLIGEIAGGGQMVDDRCYDNWCPVTHEGKSRFESAYEIVLQLS